MNMLLGRMTFTVLVALPAAAARCARGVRRRSVLIDGTCDMRVGALAAYSRFRALRKQDLPRVPPFLTLVNSIWRGVPPFLS